MAKIIKELTIKNLRKLLNYTQKDFSNEFDIPLNTVKQWEWGRRKTPPYVTKLIKRIIIAESMKTNEPMNEIIWMAKEEDVNVQDD